jgi:hypothetical protein
MTQFLVAIQHPDGYDGSLEGEAMIRDISALNKEMEAAGIRIFAGGLSSASEAKSLRAQPGGDVLVTDGPYLEAKEHGRFLDPGSRGHGRGTGMGTKGHRSLPRASRGPRVPQNPADESNRAVGTQIRPAGPIEPITG